MRRKLPRSNSGQHSALHWPLGRWLISLAGFAIIQALMMPLIMAFVVVSMVLAVFISSRLAMGYSLLMGLLISVVHTLSPGNQITPQLFEIGISDTLTLSWEESSWIAWRTYVILTTISTVVNSVVHNLFGQRPKRTSITFQLKGTVLCSVIIYLVLWGRHLLFPTPDESTFFISVVGFIACAMFGILLALIVLLRFVFYRLFYKILDELESHIL